MRDVYFLGDSRVLGALLFALALWAVWALRARKRLAFAVLVLAFVGPVLVFGVSQAVPIFYRRIVLWAAPPWFALVGAGVSYLPRPLAPFALAGLLALLPLQLVHYYAVEEKPAWRTVIQKLSEASNEQSVILNVGAERFLEYYYNRNSQPLPRRSVKNVRRAKAIESYVGRAEEFFVIAQPRERNYKELRARIVEGNRYALVMRERHGNAVLLQYRRHD